MANRNCYIDDDDDDDDDGKNYHDRSYADERSMTEHQILREEEDDINHNGPSARRSATLQWAGKFDSPTTSQTYPKLHPMIPAFNSFATQQAQDLCGNLHCGIKELRPLKIIQDPVLLSVFFGPACASIPTLDLPVTGDDGMTLREKAKALAIKVHILLSEKESTSKDSPQSDQPEPQSGRPELQNIQAGKQQDRPELKEINENKLSTGFLSLEAPFAVKAFCLNIKENSEAPKYYMNITQDY
ncbi:hypothetical protein BGZ46_004732 [Entomortierella lignicola]|nr:hypothetical protein BGZ46_004732 [Entomortierella lignicola]